MFSKNHTGPWPFRLKSGNSELATWAAGTDVTFQMGGIPHVVDGKLVPYVLGVMLTFYGTVTIVADGIPIDRSRLIRCLIDRVQVESAWHGTPISSQHVRGEYLELIETVANCLEPVCRYRGYWDNSVSTAQNFRVSVVVPLCSLLGEKGHHTAQASLCYDRAQVRVTCAAAAEIEHVTIASCYVMASALCVLEREVRLGPGVTWIDYVQTAVSGQEVVTLDSLGNSTTLNGVEPGAGLAGLWWMSNREGLPGAQAVTTATRLSVPFRSIAQVTHLDPFIHAFETAFGGRRNPEIDNLQALTTGTPGGGGDIHGLPYAPFDYGLEGVALSNPLYLTIISPSKDLEVSKLQAVEGTQPYYLTNSAAYSGEHHTLALQYHSWTPAAMADWLSMVQAARLPEQVLNTANVQWSTKMLRKQDATGVEPRKLRFCAQNLVPIAKAG